MTKYEKFNPRASAPKRPWEIHPVWQGIGCIMLILIPIMAYAGAVLLVQANLEYHWVPMPASLSRTVSIPNIGEVEYLYLNLLVAAVLALVGFALLVALYAFIYRIVGPPRLGPLDADPNEFRYRKKKRRR